MNLIMQYNRSEEYMKNGMLVISLDFELMWGMLDVKTITSYGSNVKNGKNNIPEILKLFKKYGIHATWGCVGLLYCNSIDEMYHNKPELLPSYNNSKLNSYLYFDKINYENFPLFSANKEIDLIRKTEGQEIASHTFAHYYCVEDGQTEEEFEADIKKAKSIAKKNGDSIHSIIFPRNQFNKRYSRILKENNIFFFRGNEKHFCYAPRKKTRDLLKRAIRLLDAYINLCGNHCYRLGEIEENGLLNIRSSRFLRPYSKNFRCLELMRVKRIKKQMLYAAENGLIFHLWWHPHNFGENTEKNLQILNDLLKYYKRLEKKYEMCSLNMREVGEKYYEDFGSGSRGRFYQYSS